jgi:hypothetical protein
MRSLFFVFALLFCGIANGQCVDGRCPVRATAKSAVKVVNQSVERSVLVLVNKSQQSLKVAAVKCKAVAKRDGVGRKLLGKVSSMIRRGR